MMEKRVEKLLQKLGDGIAINQEHKSELRKSFIKQRENKSSFKRYMAAACIALVAITAVFSFWFTPLNKVQADSLKVQNYMSFLELENNYDLSIAEYKGILYIPNVQEGIYKYDGVEKKKIYSGEVSLIKVSPMGTKLVFVQNGEIGVLDLSTLQSQILLHSDHKTAYEAPNWFDDQSILFTKLVMRDPSSSYYELNSGDIMKLNLEDLQQTKVAEGTNASYIASTNALLYQKGEEIMIKDLKSNREKMIDKGQQPVASKDGKAIAYSKLHIENESISKNVMIEKVLQNLWVAEGKDYGQKTMITNNITLEDIDQEEWLKNLKPSDELQILSYSGRYSYQFPTWSSDGNTIYTMRRDYLNRTAAIVKIDLGRDALSPDKVVERFLQSIQLMDEDYQRSLLAIDMKAIDDIKSKKVISYKIKQQGKLNAKTYVDAEVIVDAAENTLSESSVLRFYLSNETGQYYIVNMERLK